MTQLRKMMLEELERELHQHIRNPFRFAIRLAAGARNRLKKIYGQYAAKAFKPEELRAKIETCRAEEAGRS